jgi:diguanylate cyclase (GGDEF)-like protein
MVPFQAAPSGPRRLAGAAYQVTAEAANPGGNAIGVAETLLRAALSGAEDFAFYDREQRCIWRSDGPAAGELELATGAELHDLLTRPDPVWSRLPSGRRLLVVAETGEDGQLLGRLATVFAAACSAPGSPEAAALEKGCLSAAGLVGETLRLDRALAAERSRAEEAEQELKLVYRVDQKIHGTSRSHASLAQLVGQSGRFLKIAYSVLLLPSKRIRISATHSSWKGVNRKVLDKYLIKALFPRLQGQRFPVVFEMPSGPGSDDVSERGYQAMLCPLLDRSGNVEGILAQLGRVGRGPFRPSHQRFMAHIARKVEYVIEQSFDSMTGLTNRAGFEAQLAEARKSLAGDEDSHQIIYFDLDNLQLVNTTFGQEAGDAVISRFAQRLEEQVPPNAVAGRLTGDDFAVLLTHSSIDAALDLAAAIREDSESLRYLQGDRSLQVTVSIGIAPFDGGDVSAVLTAARIACDSAKDHGRDRVEVYDQDNQSIVRRFDNMNLVAEIQKMLDADGFELLAQPIAPLSREGAVDRFEILLRMRDADGDEVPSGSFFSAAERYQMMPQIDRWVVSRTLEILGEHAAAIRRAGALFAINLSGQSLGDDEFLSFIHQRIDASGLPPQSLCFEVTESAAVSNHAKAQAFIDALRQRGCKFSLDDFGAGLSSFAYLKSFNVDTLKIDGHFIKDISGNRISESMVAAITQVAKVMELETVAEYVETEEIREYVAHMGVDYAQGHAVGRPVPLADVLAGFGAWGEGEPGGRRGAVRNARDS